MESLSLENRGQRIQTLLSGRGKRERHGWGSGLLHYQAERVEGQWGTVPLPGPCLEGLTIQKSQGVGGGHAPAQVVLWCLVGGDSY